MKSNKIFITLLCWMLAFILSDESLPQVPDFQGMQWEDHISLFRNDAVSFPNFRRVSISRDRLTTVYETDIKAVYGVKVSRCLITFYENKFYRADVFTNDLDASVDLRDAITRKYGTPEKITEDVFIWHTRNNGISSWRLLNNFEARVQFWSDKVYRKIHNQ